MTACDPKATLSNLAEITWKQLAEKLSRQFHTETTTLISAGPMYFGRFSQKSVGAAAYVAGIRIRRFPFPFLYPKLYIEWTDIARVTEYSSLISDNRPEITEAELFLNISDVERIVLPWNTGFNQFLPDGAGYEDMRPKRRGA